MNDLKIAVRFLIIMFTLFVLYWWFAPDRYLYTPNLPIGIIIGLLLWVVTKPSDEE